LNRLKEGKGVVAIIPARGGSKSIPAKNIIDFCGKPLIAWTIGQARACKPIKEVYVSTDDREIGEVAAGHGAKVIQRPKELATDTASSESALIHAISEIEREHVVDIVVFLQATSPLREENDVDGALQKFISEGGDSLFSAAVLDDFCVWSDDEGTLKSLTYDYKQRGRRQDRNPHYLENGSIYIFKPETLREYDNRLGGKILIYPMPMWKSHEIDGMDDIELCEYYMRKKVIRNVENRSRLDNVKLIVYDFDGVMTDNTVLVSEDGLESVVVSRADGLAIGILKSKGIEQIIITTEENKVVEARARKLKLPVIRGVTDKKVVLKTYCRERSIALADVVYIGNDINDMEAMKIAGHPVCPSDACGEVKAVSKIILNVPGGSGVIRDFVRFVS
jgi:YrbI family 3-deoxy-D-manno-octulosonate 8-phosphate phosphatase